MFSGDVVWMLLLGTHPSLKGDLGKTPVAQWYRIACNTGVTRDVCSIAGVRKIPWKRKWQATPVFLLGESHGQRSLAG